MFHDITNNRNSYVVELRITYKKSGFQIAYISTMEKSKMVFKEKKQKNFFFPKTNVQF